MTAAIALDLGSTSIKAGLLRYDATLGDIVSLPAPEIIVSGEYYESDALVYAARAEQALAQCLAQTDARPPLGLCSQRSSFLIWEKSGGQPITPLISWQDTRGSASCAALRDAEAAIGELSGLRLTPYYFAPKLRVLLLEHPSWRERLERGEYLVGTLDTFLIWRWTSGRHYVTDASMAARTLLMDIRQQHWSHGLCDLFGIPLHILPQIKPSDALAIRLDNGLMLQASMADQSAAFFACAGTDSKTALVNLGTGGFVMRDMAHDGQGPEGYLRTLLYSTETGSTHIAIEGTLNSIAAALAPFPAEECRVEDMATNDILCLAEPSGLGAPYFRGNIGLRFSQSIEHLLPRQIAVLLLEGIVFRVARIVEEFHQTSALERVYLSGGLSGLVCLQQGIAQCVTMGVYRLQQGEASLLGAGMFAAGMRCTHNAVEAVAVSNGARHLPEKYRRWKIWIDGLLASVANQK
ncbi:MAG: carbohydrate kinase [Gallionellaceae bacterium]|nr:MAG: carbohydrate kinase [Gallionellaceae bacterium]